MAILWTEAGPWGYVATLPAGIVATVSRRGNGGLFRWHLTHPDIRARASGEAATLAAARAALAAAVPAFALSLADALDARASLLTARANMCRGWVST